MQSGLSDHRIICLVAVAAMSLSGAAGCRSAMDDFYWPLVEGHGKARCPITEGDQDSGPGGSRERAQQQRTGHRTRLPRFERCPAGTE